MGSGSLRRVLQVPYTAAVITEQADAGFFTAPCCWDWCRECSQTVLLYLRLIASTPACRKRRRQLLRHSASPGSFRAQGKCHAIVIIASSNKRDASTDGIRAHREIGTAPTYTTAFIFPALVSPHGTEVGCGCLKRCTPSGAESLASRRIFELARWSNSGDPLHSGAPWSNIYPS